MPRRPFPIAFLRTLKGWRRWMVVLFLGPDAWWASTPFLYHPPGVSVLDGPSPADARAHAILAAQQQVGLWRHRWMLLTDRAYRLDVWAEAAAAEIAASPAQARPSLHSARAFALASRPLRAADSLAEAWTAIDDALRARREHKR